MAFDVFQAYRTRNRSVLKFNLLIFVKQVTDLISVGWKWDQSGQFNKVLIMQKEVTVFYSTDMEL